VTARRENDSLAALEAPVNTRMEVMKQLFGTHLVRFICLFFLCGTLASSAADFNVTTPGAQFAFNINGQNSPTLTLVRGRTYTFSVSTTAGFHPFRINNAGASPNNITSGTITYVVPTDAVNHTYDCGFHGASMAGSIVVVDPPPPPTPPVPRIVSYSLGANIVLRSTPATNTFTVFPEFKTNLNETNWFALTVQSNRFLNGTNETFCGRPPGNNVFIRLRVQ
jgi:hypothetical protein